MIYVPVVRWTEEDLIVAPKSARQVTRPVFLTHDEMIFTEGPKISVAKQEWITSTQWAEEWIARAEKELEQPPPENSVYKEFTTFWKLMQIAKKAGITAFKASGVERAELKKNAVPVVAVDYIDKREIDRAWIAKAEKDLEEPDPLFSKPTVGFERHVYVGGIAVTTINIKGVSHAMKTTFGTIKTSSTDVLA